MPCFSSAIDPLSVKDITVKVGFPFAIRLLFIFLLSMLYVSKICILWHYKRWLQVVLEFASIKHECDNRGSNLEKARSIATETSYPFIL